MELYANFYLLINLQTGWIALKRLKARYTLPVSTGRGHGPWTRAVFTGRGHGAMCTELKTDID